MELLTGIEGASSRPVRRIVLIAADHYRGGHSLSRVRPGGSAVGLPQALSNWGSVMSASIRSASLRSASRKRGPHRSVPLRLARLCRASRGRRRGRTGSV